MGSVTLAVLEHGEGELVETAPKQLLAILSVIAAIRITDET